LLEGLPEAVNQEGVISTTGDHPRTAIQSLLSSFGVGSVAAARK
jgi:hypothetical protein